MIVLVKNGTYRNWKWGQAGELSNPAVCSITSKSDVKITNFPGHSPRIEFDGSGGITLNGVTRVELSGFVIEGPNYRITQEEAQAHRLTQENYYSALKKKGVLGGNVGFDQNSSFSAKNHFFSKKAGF